MNINVVGSRLEMELTESDALELIAELSASVAKCRQTGGAWFAKPVVLHKGDMAAPSRMTIRVEN